MVKSWRKKALNALKRVVAVAIGVIKFMSLFDIALITIASTVGGYYGAKFAKKIPHNLLKRVIIIVGLGLSVYYFK